MRVDRRESGPFGRNREISASDFVPFVWVDHVTSACRSLRCCCSLASSVHRVLSWVVLFSNLV